MGYTDKITTAAACGALSPNALPTVLRVLLAVDILFFQERHPLVLNRKRKNI